ncbi:MAG: autotransporter outer membrane beta-barrel domain-containing protein, partial [Brasilonema angustatum HA4187-MV1]|nr:autotransporter outer membrane beta-barrel domain-containing protein [Brasilonema angustatum HA4187-MV1]
MLNKSIAFGLLAAGLMIAPTAAFAGQSQSVDQYTEQNGAAVNGSSTVQTSTTNSRQVQNARSPRTSVNRYGH